MKKTVIIEKKATLDIIENLFNRLEYFEQDAQNDIANYTEDISGMTEEELKASWKPREIENLRVKLEAIAAIQKHLEKLI